MTSEVKQAIVAPNHAILEEKSFSIVDTHESDAPGSNGECCDTRLLALY